jgi:hypothetical protein
MRLEAWITDYQQKKLPRSCREEKGDVRRRREGVSRHGGLIVWLL